jgi:hypothetical protein
MFSGQPVRWLFFLYKEVNISSKKLNRKKPVYNKLHIKNYVFEFELFSAVKFFKDVATLWTERKIKTQKAKSLPVATWTPLIYMFTH